jgi:hypothetical protein
MAYRLPAFLTITGQINIRSTSSRETWSQSLNTEGCEAGFLSGLSESEAEVSSCTVIGGEAPPAIIARPASRQAAHSPAISASSRRMDCCIRRSSCSQARSRLHKARSLRRRTRESRGRSPTTSSDRASSARTRLPTSVGSAGGCKFIKQPLPNCMPTLRPLAWSPVVEDCVGAGSGFVQAASQSRATGRDLA